MENNETKDKKKYKRISQYFIRSIPRKLLKFKRLKLKKFTSMVKILI